MCTHKQPVLERAERAAMEYFRLEPLTSEDRAIFDRLPLRTESEYRIADERAAARCLMYHAFGSIVDAVAALEYEQRSIERGRPA